MRRRPSGRDLGGRHRPFGLVELELAASSLLSKAGKKAGKGDDAVEPALCGSRMCADEHQESTAAHRLLVVWMRPFTLAFAAAFRWIAAVIFVSCVKPWYCPSCTSAEARFHSGAVRPKLHPVIDLSRESDFAWGWRSPCKHKVDASKHGNV